MTIYQPPEQPDETPPEPDEETLPAKPGPEQDLPAEGDPAYHGQEEEVPDEDFMPPDQAAEDDTIDDTETEEG